MIRTAISKVVDKQDLTEHEAAEAMRCMVEGRATPSQIAALITALRMKGETVDEIVGFAGVMREKSTGIMPDTPLLVDTCGTGGDGSNTFNISTASAFVIAGAGVPVAKHGNRSVSSRSGSADVLEALNVRIDLPAEAVKRSIEEVGIGFMFAPYFHPSMRHAVTPRREVGIRTIFNLLGPLTNPASAHVQVVGVYDANLTEPVANVLSRLGTREAYVVHGLDRLDEISICGPTKVSHFNGEDVRTFEVRPEDVGLSTSSRQSIEGGDPTENAAIIESVLKGERGPRRDVVVFNAAAAFVAAGIADDLINGVKIAEQTIDEGKAKGALDALVEYTRSQEISI